MTERRRNTISRKQFEEDMNEDICIMGIDPECIDCTIPENTRDCEMCVQCRDIPPCS